VTGGRAIDLPLAHIDVTPTLLELCKAKGDAFDGRSFARMLAGGPGNWPGRTLFFQWHRGDEPEKFRAIAARGPRYKLVQAAGVQPNATWKPKYELFDIDADPFEEKDLAAEKPDEVAYLKHAYENWFADVTKKGFTPQRIVIGSEKENPVRLSRQDWRGPKAGWAADSAGHWEVKVLRAGRYKVTVHAPGEFDRCELRCEGVGHVAKFSTPRKNQVTFETELVAREGRLEVTVTLKKKGGGAHHVVLEYLGPAKE